MKFSIVTCTWNSERYLAQSIASVLAQDYPDIEYIFVDGGSTDGTLERIRSIPRPVRLIENTRGGISRAMNRGIAAASGDVIGHLHSDDYYLHPRVLSLVAEALARTKRSWAIGVSAVDRGGNLRYPPPRPFPYSYFNFLALRFFIAHPSTFVRRDVWQKIGVFDETLQYAMDIDLWLRIGRRFDPVILDEALTAFRVHPGSRSNANPSAALREQWGVHSKYLLSHPFASSLGLPRLWLQQRRWARRQNASWCAP
jgi:glycosyltransferase involved in cell wall biosynthesis